MKLDYSGAKTPEEARAIHQAFWDQIHQELLEGRWKRITREELFAQAAAIRAQKLKEIEEQKSRNNDNQSPADNAA